MSKIQCVHCNEKLCKNLIGLNKKLLGRRIGKFMCLECLAEHLDCSTDDLLVKIEEFKEQGCALFR